MFAKLAPLVFLLLCQLSSAAPEPSALEPTIGVVAVSDNAPTVIWIDRSKYPPKAIEDGISGHVLVQFTVTPYGGADNVQVIEAHPKGIFDKSARRAVQKGKYKMKVVDGVPVENPGVVVKLTYDVQPAS